MVLKNFKITLGVLLTLLISLMILGFHSSSPIDDERISQTNIVPTSNINSVSNQLPSEDQPASAVAVTIKDIPQPPSPEQGLVASSNNTISQEQSPQNTEIPADITAVSPAMSPVSISSIPIQDLDKRQYHRVVKVVDGDTIDVVIDNKIERLRLIGLDTPETVDPRKPIECFGLKASGKAKQLLLNKEVYLEADASQGDRGSYGRLLRYVFLKDGTHYNLEMIKQGYAHEYTYKIPYKYQLEFKQAQTVARQAQLGLWHPEACLSSQPSNPDNAVSSLSPLTSTCHPAYEPCLPIVADLNCKDVESKIMIKQIGVDPYNLDRNRDGIAC